LKCLHEETESHPQLPRLEARGGESPIDTTNRLLEECATARKNAPVAEEINIQFIQGKNRALEYYKLFLVPFDGRRLFTHNRSFLQADRLQTFIEFTAICPTLLDFREGFTIHIKHTISTNVINITSVGHAAGCLNLENEVQSEDIPVCARRYIVKQFLREVHEYVTHSQGPGIRRGKHGEFKNDTADASELNEDDTLAISTALALYGHNIFLAGDF
jgi:hypothetical protein